MKMKFLEGMLKKGSSIYRVCVTGRSLLLWDDKMVHYHSLDWTEGRSDFCEDKLILYAAK